MQATKSTGSTVSYFVDLELGQSWTSEGRTITEADLVTFGTWSGDMHPLHTNAEYASKGPFGERIFHGPGGLALAFGLEMRLGWKMGSAIAFLGLNNWTMTAPIFIGDTITVREKVTDLRASNSKPDRGIVTTRVELVKQDGQVTQSGDWVVLLSKRPTE